MQKWSASQRRKFKATMAEKAALREMLPTLSQGAAPPQRVVVTELAVGSQIAFSMGEMKLIVRAVDKE